MVEIADLGLRNADFKKGYLFRLPFTVHDLPFTRLER